MPEDTDLITISRMLENARSETSIVLAEERVVCGSSELRKDLTLIDRTLAASATTNHPCRIALFSDDDDECSMIGAAVVERAKALGFQSFLTHKNWGLWAAQAVRKKMSETPPVHVLAGVPPEKDARQGFAAIDGHLILLWPLSMVGAALLPDGVEELILPPFTQRPLDKAAHVIANAMEALEAAEQNEEEIDQSLLLKSMPAVALLAVCWDRLKLVDVSTARDAGRRLAIELRKQAALRPGEPLTAADLTRALFPQPQSLPPNLRRLWVEGDTDVSLFKLAARLMRAACGGSPGGLDSIEIEPLGGAAQVEAALQRCDRDRNLECFLFDADTDGERGAKKAIDRGFTKTLLLDRSAVMAACDAKWVIEDLLSVACLDRFYCAHPDLKPAREEITHHPVEGRRLVVRGEDKRIVVEWLEENATLNDMFGIVRQLLIVRRQFALREPQVKCDPPADGRCGLRQQPWWFVSRA